MSNRKARITTFLAPNMLPLYQLIADHLSQRIGYSMELVVGSSYQEVYQSEFSFICGLPYVLRTPPREHASIQAIAAPVLVGERYHNKPIYFSDVIVHKNSSFHSFPDLRGHSWAYNEPESQSGYGITRYWLARSGDTNGYFSRIVEAGFHQTAIRMVYDGQVEGAAIDSLVLDTEFRLHPELANGLRVIDSLGPSTVQPFVASANAPSSLVEDIRAALIEMHRHDEVGNRLRDAGIDHFVTVNDADYNDIRHMLIVCEASHFLTLK
jgi:phosphonate transport system substrate-binding protein